MTTFTPLKVNLAALTTSSKLVSEAMTTSKTASLAASFSTFNLVQQAAVSVARTDPAATATYKLASSTSINLQPRDQTQNLYLTARRTLLDLRDQATTGAEKALLQRIMVYLRANMTAGEQTALLPQIYKDKDGKEGFDPSLPSPGQKLTTPTGTGSATEEAEHTGHSALFSMARIISADMRSMQALHHALITLRRRQQKELMQAKGDLSDLLADIAEESPKLDALARQRVEAHEDYLLAQRLLADHWKEVEQAWEDRRRVIESHQGVYYTRVRETPLSRSLPDPLDLRAASPDDIVPGCPNRDRALPDELDAFMDAILDIPAADWASLSGLATLLPGRQKLESMVQIRRQKLGLRLNQSAKGVVADHPTLNQMHGQNRNLAREVAARPFNATSLAALQHQGHAILSVEDLLASSSAQLRQPAQQLHQRLDAAAGGLLDTLRAVTPSLRLAWAGAAEDDDLPVNTPERWRGLEKAEKADFNNTRTLVELVAWWNRQLTPTAAGSSRTALRNLIRACVLLSANDDPHQLLQGSVATLPSHFRIGEPMRVSLNKEPAPGALLQLMDDKQKLIGLLRVEDHDANGTLVTVTSVLDAKATLSTGLMVSGKR